MRVRQDGLATISVSARVVARSLAALLSVALAAGCAVPYSLSIFERHAAAEDIRGVVERRLAEATAADGSFAGAGDYQRDEDMRRYRDESRGRRQGASGGDGTLQGQPRRPQQVTRLRARV